MFKRLMFAFLLVSGLAVAAFGEPAVLHSISELNAAVEHGDEGALYALEASVIITTKTYGSSLVLQDETGATTVWVHAPFDLNTLRCGDLVRASGDVKRNGRGGLSIDCLSLKILERDRLPEPLPVSGADVLSDSFPKKLIRLEGTVTDAGPDEIDVNWSHVVLSVDGVTVYVVCHTKSSGSQLGDLIGARVRVIGVIQSRIQGLQLIKRYVLVNSLDSITVLSPAEDLFSAPDIATTPLFVNGRKPEQTRLAAAGSVLAGWDGNKILLRTDSGQLVKGELSQEDPPPCGSRIRLVGTPETDFYNVILARAYWRAESGPAPSQENAAPVSPNQLQREQLGVLRYDFSYHGRAVSVSGVICSMPTPGIDGRLFIDSDGRLVTVDVSAVPDAVRDLGTGFVIGVSGICVMESEKIGISQMFPHISGYRIVPRTADDIRILARPPWWTPARLLVVIGALSLGLVGIFVWNLQLRRLSERRGRQLADERFAREASELKVVERTRLAVELHDSISQNLTGVSMEVRAARRLADTDKAAMQEYLDLALKTIDSSRGELRNCIWDLRSRALEEKTFDRAIRLTVEPHLGDAQALIRFNIPRDRISDDVANAFLRIIRELVVNAIRHGRAKTIRIAGSLDGDTLLFSVQDDGSGFVPDDSPGMEDGHFGLQGIRERIKVFGGKLVLSSEPGKGTKAVVSIPLAATKRT